MTRTFVRTAALSALAALLSMSLTGCGQTGPLTLPDPATAAPTSASPQASQTAGTDGQKP